MPLPQNITKEHILKSIEKIDKEGIPSDGDSKYYDVVFNNKMYPPKLLVSYANLFANGEILDRSSFEGGLNTECFKLLNKYEFEIKGKTNNEMTTTNIWFVAQGSTYTSEKGMKFLWAPSKGKGDTTRFYWENLLKVKKGDIIFHYSEGLKGVSIALNDGYNSENTDESSPWLKDGYRVDVDLVSLDPIITRDVLRKYKAELFEYLLTITNKPFNTEGGVNQGYLYEFSKEAGRFIRDIYKKPFGKSLIDNYFDEVRLDVINNIKKINLYFAQKEFYEQSKTANFFISQDLSCRFISSLITKPFVILTGLSGSGKTKLAQAFAMWICKEENQYCIIPVGADWTNREPLLGYPNALESGKYVQPENGALQLIIDAVDNPEQPYFLILDEMNLSHVERYFADFLSAMESSDDISLHNETLEWKDDIPAKIKLPKNLFIIGTVNIDETTYMFSPKVLDRANVIEFRVSEVEMEDYLMNNKPLDLDTLKSKGANMGKSFVEIATAKNRMPGETEEMNKTLIAFFSELKKSGAEFGYRSAAEIIRFAGVVNTIEPAWSMTKIIDAAIMQKLLPKVHGSRRKLEPILNTLGKLCLQEGQKIEDFILPKLDIVFDDSTKIKYPLSLEKILRMRSSLISNGFTSYAEA